MVAAAAFAGNFSVSNRADEPCRTGTDYPGLFGGAIGVRSGADDWGDAADREPLPQASSRTGSDRGAGRSAACRTRPGHHGRGEDLAGGVGVPEAQRAGLSSRAVDHSAARRACPSTRPAGRASQPRETGPRDGLQDPGRAEVKPHKVRYYLEKRDPEFGPKMAEILCVYRQVAMLRGQAGSGHNQGQDGGGDGSLAIVSYDEKPGIQAIATTAPDRPPLPGTSPTVMRDHEYKRHGTLTLMAGIDLLTGHVHALVKDRHRSREFIEFLKL